MTGERSASTLPLMHIRQATHDDIPAIISFTTNTFEWGDYVPDAIRDWIDDPNGMTMVALDGDEPIAVARTVLLAPTEAWGHGVRVSRDHRGTGVAGLLVERLLSWVRTTDAHIVRLMIEDDNTSSIRHVEKVGFRRTVRMMRAVRSVGEATPNPEGNGVRHAPSTLRAIPGRGQDAPLVMSAWTSSDVGRAMRGLIGIGWQFHTMRTSDVQESARLGGLWDIGGSWAMTSTNALAFRVAMLDVRPEDAYESIRALIDIANNQGAEQVSIWIPTLDWLVQATRRAGCDVSPSSIWVYPL